MAASDSGWAAVGAQLRAALEPRRFTVRDERVFDVVRADPRGEEWNDLRHVRQILLVGSARDPWVAAALGEAEGPAPHPPALVRVRNVWARPQSVTILLLPPGRAPESLPALLSRLSAAYLRDLEEATRARMFASGANSVLADSLRRTAGFSLVVPRVYRHAEVRPGLWVFRNDQPDPSRLIRQIVVTALPSAEGSLSAAAARRARERLSGSLAQPPQVTDSVVATWHSRAAGRPMLQLQGVWSNPPGAWPAAGPFITRVVRCGGREYLLDAWLYAPGRPKYPYLVQLVTVLDSFRCPAPE